MLCLVYFRDTHAFIRFTGYTLGTIRPLWPLSLLLGSTWVPLGAILASLGAILVPLDGSLTQFCTISVQHIVVSVRSGVASAQFRGILAELGVILVHLGAIPVALGSFFCCHGANLFYLLPLWLDFVPHWLNLMASLSYLAPFFLNYLNILHIFFIICARNTFFLLYLYLTTLGLSQNGYGHV